jgi:hypothetical protein
MEELITLCVTGVILIAAVTIWFTSGLEPQHTRGVAFASRFEGPPTPDWDISRARTILEAAGYFVARWIPISEELWNGTGLLTTDGTRVFIGLEHSELLSCKVTHFMPLPTFPTRLSPTPRPTLDWA